MAEARLSRLKQLLGQELPDAGTVMSTQPDSASKKYTATDTDATCVITTQQTPIGPSPETVEQPTSTSARVVKDPSKGQNYASKKRSTLWLEKAGCQHQAGQRYLKTATHDDEEGGSSFGQDVVLIAIDIEAYERDHNKVTEVGIASLDMRIGKTMLADQPSLRNSIKARHFLIEEHRHLHNHEFVKGCPDKFEFGDIEIVALRDLPQVLARCFRPPFDQDSLESADEKRDVVLVGHDLSGDIDYCHQIGFSILNRSSIVDKLDTSIMYQAISNDSNKNSLGTLLYNYGLDAWNPHNAGNDAVYTLWALLAMCAPDKSNTTQLKDS